MKQQLAQLLKLTLDELGIKDVDVSVEQTTDFSHGDYTTNVAMLVGKQLKQNPVELAEKIKQQLAVGSMQFADKTRSQITGKQDQKTSGFAKQNRVLQDIEKIKVVAPGFINFYLSASALSRQLDQVLKKGVGFGRSQLSDFNSQLSEAKKTKRIMVEYGDPNTHKPFHIGHLRNITIGESVIRLQEAIGYKVMRANYQGDVGMHIAKTLFGVLAKLKSQKLKFKTIAKKLKTTNKKVEFLGKAYVEGSKAYDEDEKAKKEIHQINKQIYAQDPAVWDIYQTTRQWSLDYFETIYKRVGSHYDRYYFESEVFVPGKENVEAGLEKGIFMKSDGAVIFPGKKQGLHDRVFITAEGNPTYEGKDMALGILQYKELQTDQHIPELIIRAVGPEQSGYFKVVFEAQAQLFPELRDKFYHLVCGWVRLKKGKMSSRSGQVILGEWLLDEVKQEIYNILQSNKSKYKEKEPFDSAQGKQDKEKIAETTAIAAVKYSFLKVTPSQEIAFDIKESVNIQGDSGPYLLYTYARARSIVRKAKEQKLVFSNQKLEIELNTEEQAVLRWMYRYPEVVSDAARNYNPSTLCGYLYQLASLFNTFYNKHSILGKAKKDKDMTHNTMTRDTVNLRLALTISTAQVLKNGLHLLGMRTLEKM